MTPFAYPYNKLHTTTRPYKLHTIPISLYQDEEDMTPFAFRTHTHKLGVRVSAWRERDGDWTLLGTGDPQKPQMFYLMGEDKHVIKTG